MILALVGGLAEEVIIPSSLDAGVVTRGDGVGAVSLYGLPQRSEFDGSVAGHAGVGGTALLVGLNEILNDGVAEYVSHVIGLVGNAQSCADSTGVGDVPRISRLAVGAVQGHGGSCDVVPLLQQQVGGHRGIHTAAHGGEYTSMHGNLLSEEMGIFVLHLSLAPQVGSQLTLDLQAVEIILPQYLVDRNGY